MVNVVSKGYETKNETWEMRRKTQNEKKITKIWAKCNVLGEHKDQPLTST